MNGNTDKPIAVALTGASGIQYGLRLIECLLDADRTVYLMASQAAQVVANMESDLQLPSRPEEMQHHLSFVEEELAVLGAGEKAIEQTCEPAC